MRSLILGTAGHIDHGKTALVRVLTGVDTDRLKEEKARGITIDLGFAELTVGEDLAFGVVDVPGHESFIRNMLAGATGMDVVLLVVAADEGAMPQTREHLAIVRLLGVERLVVALTKADLVEPDWLELAEDDVRQLLAGTRYADAPIIPTSSITNTGLDELRDVLAREGGAARERADSDIARLPVDRAFSVRGTGTVVTGTLWSGSLSLDQRVRLEPSGPSARIRGLQVHGRDVDKARAGERAAVALSGSGVDARACGRGHSVVAEDPWVATERITARVSLLDETAWQLERGQRVRVHLGTAEVMARAFVLDADVIVAGERAWVQLRLEAPLVARCRDRLVLRSYSPVTTIGGGEVAEPSPPRRTRLRGRDSELLDTILDADPSARHRAVLELAAWAGITPGELPIRTGDPPVEPAPAGTATEPPLATGRALYSDAVVLEGSALLKSKIAAYHRAEPLRPGMPLELARQSLPRSAGPELADALLVRLVASGELDSRQDLVSEPGFKPRLSAEQERAKVELLGVYQSAGLSPPAIRDLPPELRSRSDLWPLLKLLEEAGSIVALTDEFFAGADAVANGARAVTSQLKGRSGLGPADFREILPVTRKHLLPLLAYFDSTGVTIRRGDGRDVVTR